MDILNWLRIKKQNLIRTTLDSPKDLVVLGADVSYQKRGDKYQSYAMPAEDFLATAARPYKVYTALLTQSGNSDGQTIYNVPLTIGVTYFINNNDGSGDFTNVGASSNEQGTYFVATGTTPNSWGTISLVDLAYNSGAPVVTILENTLGNVWFTYGADGFYYINSNDLFTNNKTWVTSVIILGVGGPASRGSINTNDSNTIGIITESDVDTPSNNILSNTPIEIRVYN